MCGLGVSRFRRDPIGRSGPIVVLTLVLGLVSSTLGSGQPGAQENAAEFPADDPQVRATLGEMESQLRAGNRKAGIPGMAAALVSKDGVLWSSGIGVTDSTSLHQVTTSTMFSLQSISKLVTTTALMIAVQDGLLDLDTPITAYLPDFTVNSRYEDNPADRITLRLLLAHRAGLTHEAAYGNNYDSGETSFEKHVQSISHTWLRYPVGTRYAYSNLGIDLAGYILQVVSGRPFARFVEERLLAPLGMKNTSYDWEAIERSENRASGYDRDDPNLPLRHALVPCGGCFSTADDMAEFIRFHMNGGLAHGKRILSPELLEEMYEIQNSYEGQVFGYCLGICKGWLWGEDVYENYYLTHNGSGFGFNASVEWFPEYGLGAVVLVSGGSSYFATEMAHNLVKFGISQVGGLKTRRLFAGVDSLRYDAPWLDDWLGSYIRPTALVIAKSEGGYRISTEGDKTCPLIPISENEAYYETGRGFITLLRFVESTLGAARYVVKVHRGETYDYNDGPADPVGPDRAEWSKYTGEYKLMRYGRAVDMVKVSVKNGYLYLDSWELKEYLPGLFFTAHGEALDLRGDEATYRNIRLRKVSDG